MEEFRKKIIQVLSLITLMVAFGTIGYMVIEGWSFDRSRESYFVNLLLSF